MANLLTATQLREHIDTDLGDDALNRLATDADDEIVRRFGPHTSANTETFRPSPGQTMIWTYRPISSITSITETDDSEVGETATTLAANDYAVEGRRTLRRKTGGTNSSSCWAPLVVVVYTPTDDSDRRKRVTIDLVRLAVEYQARQSSSLGDVQISHVQYAAERERLLGVLSSSMLGQFA